MAQGGNARMATGTFTNNDTSTVSLNIGFKPDVVYISCGYAGKHSQSGWTGCAFMIIVKDETVAYYRHNNDTTTSTSVGLNTNVGGTNGEYGNNSTAPSGASYATYNNGILTIENKSPTQVYTHFMADETYTWIAFATI